MTVNDRVNALIADGIQRGLTVKEILHELRGLELPIDTQAIALELIATGARITKPFME